MSIGGVSGDRCQNLLERYQKDILEVKPDYLSIMIGINDTWRRYDSNDITSKEQFETNLTELLEKIKKGLPDTKLMLIEPFCFLQIQKRNLLGGSRTQN